MKKVKVMLAAVAIFAVVGGALAFKAKTQTALFCAPQNQGLCTEETPGISTTGDVIAQENIRCTTVFESNCAATTVYLND